jgi:hypothetical protein
VNALVEADDGVYTVDVERDEVVDFVAGARLDLPSPPKVELPRVVAAAAAGATVVAVVDRKPPLMVSHDGGRTWREAGAGLPKGTAVAVGEDNPDLVLFAARGRLYVSRDGGRFWAALTPELPEILGVTWAD